METTDKRGWTIARALRRLLRASPVGPLAVRTADWVKVKRRRPGVRAEDVGEVLAALEADGVAYWLSGGWGIDALNGRQCRSHFDLDVVLDRFEETEPRARRTLAPLGYRMVEHRQIEGLWMPRCSVLKDGAGRRVDLLNLDWGLVRTALGLPEADEDDNRHALFTHGEIRGQKVPCLTPAMQVLFHGGYESRPCDRFDISRLARRYPDALKVTARG